MTRILVTGATGFIGRRLVPALVEEGHDVRAMTRHPETYDGPGEPVAGDVHDADSLVEPLRGRRRRLLPGALARRRRLRAQGRRGRAGLRRRPPPSRACARSSTWAASATTTATCRPTSARAARSRACSASTGIPVTVLRAAIVVGHGGISWELTRQLVKNLPAMVVPEVGEHQHPADRDRRRGPLPRGRRRPRGGARPGLRDRRPRPADLRRHAPRGGRDREGSLGADHRGAGADTAAVVVLAGAGDRRRRHHRAQPDRLDGHRGAWSPTSRSARWSRASR